MKVIIYTTIHIGCAGKLLGSLFSVLLHEQIYLTFGIERFTHALLKNRIDNPIVVIQISRTTNVMEVIDLSDLLDGLSLIFITDRKDKDFLSICWRFYPRLLVTNKEDFSLIAAMFKKWLGANGSGNLHAMGL